MGSALYSAGDAFGTVPNNSLSVSAFACVSFSFGVVHVVVFANIWSFQAPFWGGGAVTVAANIEFVRNLQATA